MDQPGSPKMVFGFGVCPDTLDPTLLKINYPYYGQGPWLSPSYTLMEIKENNDVSLFVTCACGSPNGIPHLYIDQHRENTTTIGQTRIIPSPADITEGGPSSIMPTQEYVRKIMEDASEDDHFTRGPWLSVLKYCNAFGIVVDACLGDIEKFCKKWKVKLAVAIIKSCKPNSLGELTNNTQKSIGNNVWYNSSQTP
ncbi:hypothetical protein CTI12_AA200270 [Artemisia annua]|uniref:Uncharacterized protein n=1 Tax=Artemisia annua TaxID=35608 RepID=A0A2U1P326_ARTAN|nr:hypothetical protein CTI12_AA200270 [Artemisia annua]